MICDFSRLRAYQYTNVEENNIKIMSEPFILKEKNYFSRLIDKLTIK